MMKTELKVKNAKRERKFVKDKAIVNFLLEHMKPAKIDFSKIKIPSFINFIENEENITDILNAFPNKKFSNEGPLPEKYLLNSLLETEKN